MKLLLTGANGFTGKHFTEIAQNSDYEVIALKADLTDFKAVNAEIESIQPEIVVHLAAISFVAHDDADVMYQVNVLGTRHLLQALAALRTKPKAILLASSANIYGSACTEILDEASAQRPMNDYGVSKLAMEHIARLWMKVLPIIITRPFNYTGLGQDPKFVIPKIVNNFIEKSPIIELGNLDVFREFSDVRTVCHTYLKLLNTSKSLGETINICTGKSYSLNEMISMMEDMSGHSINIKINPIYVRPNEIKRLVGSNQRLHQIIGEQVYPDIKETLEWMYGI